ncbi:MAG: ATP-dependent Clp protease ATP-binding subunit [Parcubacteria group bacterium]|nr:ATP-dependent Clp protease ATP-binding subunit [Parcubacteria group bacterium]
MHRETFSTHFQDGFFSLSYTERLFVKASFAALAGVSVAAAALFLPSEISRLRWLGVLLVFFLIDRLVQLGRGEIQIGSDVVKLLGGEKSLNITPYFQARTKKFLEHALNLAELTGARSVLSDLLLDLLRLPEVQRGLLRIGVAQEELVKMLNAKKEKATGNTGDSKERGEEIALIANLAFREAIYLGEHAVSPGALFLGALSSHPEELEDIFSQLSFVEEDLHNAIVFGRLAQGLGKRMLRQPAVVAGRRRLPRRIMNRAWTARPTPFLDQVSEDLTALARANAVGFLVGHEVPYESLVAVLSREEKNNALLVGEAGIGKSTIVAHLAFKITRDEVPGKLFDRRVVSLNISAVTSGAKTAGEIQERFERLADEILLAGNIVLHIADIHNLKLTGGEGLNAFEVLKPILSASLIPVVGDTVPQEYRKVVEQDSDFRSLFEVVRVEELSEADAVRYLTYQSFILEAKWRITISYRALKRAVELAHHFLRQKPLPTSALDLLQETVADVKNQKRVVVSEEDVANLVARKTKIPMGIAVKAEAEKLLELEARIHERLVNQEEAVKAVSSAMRQYRAGLAREKGPIAAFLFAGPTGVGKTELSKALTEIYFGSEDDMIRFDMTEYQDPKAIWSFIGSPDGAVKGNLTEAVKVKPFSLVLLDEFEKAHPDIVELFLPLFDEGRITDSLGTPIDFTHTIIIATSNAHSELIKTEIERGTPMPDISAMVKKRLTEYFKPELINRFDGIIVFRPLTQEEIEKIAALNVKKLFGRLEKEQGISAEIDPAVYQLLARLGWDPVFGARPLRGVIRGKVSETLAQKILRKEIGRGDKIKVEVSGEDVDIKKA